MFDTVLVCITAAIPLFGIAAAVRPQEFCRNEKAYGKIRCVGVAVTVLGFVISALVLLLKE